MPRITVYIDAGVTYEVITRPPVVEPPPPMTAKFAIGGTAYATLGAAMTALKDGETLDIAPGTYSGEAGFSRANNITIRGVGGEAVFTGNAVWGGKSKFTLEGANVTLRNLAAEGVSNGSGNGGLIRFDGENLTAEDCRWDRCETGILSGYGKPASVIRLTRIKAKGNGTTGGGYDHAIYIGGGAALYLTDSRIEDTNVGHLVKSRAGKTVITGCVLIEGRASRTLDIPLGGVLEVRNTYIKQTNQTDNSSIMSYGDDCPTGADGKRTPVHAVNTVTLGPDVLIFDERDGATKPPTAPPWYKLKCWLTPTALDDQSKYNTGADPYPTPIPPPPPPPPVATIVDVTRDAAGLVTPSFWSSLPVRQWASVRGVRAAVLEAQLRAGFTDFGNNKFPAVFTAWSGASYRNRRLVGTGGGHLDSANNMVWELNVDTLQFRIVAQPTTTTMAQWQQGWAVPTTDPDAPEFRNRWEMGIFGTDETVDGQCTPHHTYGALAQLPDGELVKFGWSNVWGIKPDGTYRKIAAGCRAYWFETMAQFYGGMVYQAGMIRYQSCIFRVDPATGAWKKFPLVDTKGIDKTFWLGHQDQANWVDDAGRWWFPTYGFYIDLTHPALACSPITWGSSENGRMDAGAAWHNGRKRAYWLGYGVDHGNVYEGDTTSGALVVKKIGSGSSVAPATSETFGRFFCDESLDVLGWVSRAQDELQLFKL